MKRTSRAPSELSQSIHQQLNSYALAAAAAGVSALALFQPAEAKIIYTPVHKVIGKNGFYGIDFNHDGIVEVGISNASYRFGRALTNIIGADSQGGSENVGIVEIGGGVRHSSWPGQFLLGALRQSARIGYDGGFVYEHGILVGQCAHGTSNSAPPCSDHRYHTLGAWANVKNRYLGVTFTVHGKTHYGWARLTVKLSRIPFKATAILTGYAYETIPGKAIKAGQTKEPEVTVEPGSLGALAAGASKLAH